MNDQDPEYAGDDAGNYGPTVLLRPLYADDGQRKRLRPLLWRGDDPKPEFAKALCTAAKTALAKGLENALGKIAYEEAQLSFSSRMSLTLKRSSILKLNGASQMRSRISPSRASPAYRRRPVPRERHRPSSMVFGQPCPSI